MIPTPGYIDPEAWQGFCEMRHAMPKTRPFTTRAAKLILYELQRIKEAGHDPNAALDQSTLKGWTDVYPAVDKQIVSTSQVECDRTQQLLAEQRAHAAKCAAQRAMRKAAA